MMDKEGEDIQTKGIDNLFNNIIAENLPNVEKRRDIPVQKEYQTIRARKETPQDIS
jgi:hypothetical protein